MSVGRRSHGGWFLGPDGRPWPVMRVGLYLIAYGLANLVLTAPILILAGSIAPAAAGALASNLLMPLGLLVVAASTVATVLATWAFCRWIDRRSWLDLGARRDGDWLRTCSAAWRSARGS